MAVRKPVIAEQRRIRLRTLVFHSIILNVCLRTTTKSYKLVVSRCQKEIKHPQNSHYTAMSAYHPTMAPTTTNSTEENQNLLSTTRPLSIAPPKSTHRSLLLLLVLVLLSASISILFVICVSTLQTARNTSRNAVSKQQDPCWLHPLTCDTDSSFKSEYDHIPKSVLVVAAHPDDIETSAGGTLTKWAQNGQTDIYYVMITNGDKGTGNRSMTSEELGRIRQQEQRNAGAVVGVKDIFFLNVPDGDVTNNDELRRNITYYIRLLRPEIMITWDPTWHLDLFQFGLEHRDHRTAGQAAIDSVWPNSNDFLYYPDMNLPTYRPKTVLLFRFGNDFEFNAPQSQVFVPLGEAEVSNKIKAIYQHKSQFPNEESKEHEKTFLTSMATKLGKNVRKEYAELFTLVRFMG